MNHRSVLNGTPLDARHDNVALDGPAARLRARAVRLHRHERRPPHGARPTIRGCRRYEGVLPGFDPVCHLPEGDPLRVARLDARRRASTSPTTGARSSTSPRARNSRGARSTTPSTLRPRSSPTGCSTASTADPARRAPWFAHLSFLRPHPPFLAPAPYDTMFDPASVPAPVRARRHAPTKARSIRCSA